MRSSFRRRLLAFAIAAAIALPLVGCLRPGLRPRLIVAVNISPDANHNEPIAVDLLEIDDKDLLKDVAKMTASDWFQKRDQIRHDFPKSKSIAVRSWEWVPGQVVPEVKIPMRKPPRLILVFAKYATPGPHRVVLDPAKPISLQFAREDMKVEPLAK